ncbi:MAG: hypothetical protein ABL927_10775 [Bdellovibrionales bacterium]
MKQKQILNRNLIVFLIFIIAPVASLFAATPPTFKPGRITASAQVEYFMTSSNFDTQGNPYDFQAGNSYSNVATTYDGTYTLPNYLQFKGGFGYSYAQSTTLNLDRTNGAITDVHGSILYQIKFGKLHFIPQADALFAINKIDVTSDKVITNDGVNTYQGGSWLTYDISAFRLYGFLGYQNRSGGVSSLLPWRVGATGYFSSYKLSADIGGYKSITDDEYTTFPSLRTGVNNITSGNSLLYNGINPNLTELRAQVEYVSKGSFDFYAGASYALAGESVAKGESFFGGLTYKLDAKKASSDDTTYNNSSTTESYGPDSRYDKKKPDPKFEPNVEEDYNDSLFTPEK